MEILVLALIFWAVLAIFAIFTAVLREHPYVGPIIVIALFVPIFGGAAALAWACSPLPKKEPRRIGYASGLSRTSRAKLCGMVQAKKREEANDDFLDSLR